MAPASSGLKPCCWAPGCRITGDCVGGADEGPALVVARHVDHVRLGRLDHDAVVDARDDLRLVVDEPAGRLGLLAQPLHAVEHVPVLLGHGEAEPLGVVEVVGHAPDHLRETGEQHKHARVPVARVDRLGDLVVAHVGAVVEDAVGVNDLQREGRGDQHLREQRVRIERDRRDEVVDLVVARSGRARRRRRAGRRPRRARRSPRPPAAPDPALPARAPAGSRTAPRRSPQSSSVSSNLSRPAASPTHFAA